MMGFGIMAADVMLPNSEKRRITDVPEYVSSPGFRSEDRWLPEDEEDALRMREVSMTELIERFSRTDASSPKKFE
jgi:hypothetical protein